MECLVKLIFEGEYPIERKCEIIPIEEGSSLAEKIDEWNY